jgi:NADH-quinone oxidoreductase subunit N
MTDLYFSAALPELLLAFSGLGLLMLGVFAGPGSARLVSWLAVGVLLAASVLALTPEASRTTAFSGLFVADPFASFAKVLAFLATAATIVMGLEFNRREGFDRFEYPVLMLFAALGMSMMVSANDLMSLYMGLELQSLSLYVLAAFRRDSVKAPR